MSDKRIVKEGNRYYPEYYKNKWFFNLFGGYWKRYKSDELWLNGYFTELLPCDLSYSNLEMARDYFKEETKEIIEL